jgi:excisionase family DNA binding protein
MQAPALTLKDFCDAYRVCRETVYQQIRAGRLRAVKLGRKTHEGGPGTAFWPVLRSGRIARGMPWASSGRPAQS